MIEYFNFLLDELIFRYDVCQCRDEHWKTYDKEEHVNDIRAAATALFDRYTKDSLGKGALLKNVWKWLEKSLTGHDRVNMSSYLIGKTLLDDETLTSPVQRRPSE